MSALWTWLTTSWLGRKVSLYAIKFLILLVKVWNANRKKESKEKQNEEIKEKVENAKTPEEKQDAITDVANRWGK